MLLIETGKCNTFKAMIPSEHDKKRFKEIYNRFSGKMYSLCVRYTGNTKDAEINFINGIALWYKRFRLSDSLSTEAAVRKIFICCCIDFLKEKEKNLFNNKSLWGNNLSIDTVELPNMSSTDLIQIIQQLPTQERIIVNLWFVEEYSIEEISDLLLIDEIYIQSLVGQSTKTFRKIISPREKSL